MINILIQVELPGCKGIWTVYYKNSRSLSADSLKAMLEEDEYHAYLIISIESRTMVRFIIIEDFEILTCKSTL